MRKFFKAFWHVTTWPLRALWQLLSLPFRWIKKIVRFLNETPEENQLPDIFSASIQKPALMVEHFNDLRKHLFRILIALILCIIVMGIFSRGAIDFLALPIGGLDQLIAIDVTESVGVFMRVVFMGALVLVSPYIAFELWMFAAPGLMPSARKLGLLGIPLVLIFFIIGIAFTYKFLLPTALPFLLNFMDIQALPRVSSYINFVTGIMFWIGISFEFPLLTYMLTMMGLIQPRQLVIQWRGALVIIAIVSAAITPTPDPVNMSIVMAPLLLLYLISIGLSYMASMGNKKNHNLANIW